ncbi:host attachment family protein [Pseudohoeflea coraliihabitans]|uniref:Host attachment family protein n=1 Tax=Pseudohoeflea coraliihabitans TaxID=2860393 RepID=A0ABS6WM40_9HYPH|nr:host attachment family protein [Pseudohoeflea sp. DP4N28-3]MBW3097014.1 host attachment family protein [Pseudohoeflea sp. DP4N28-3]
MSDIRLKHDGWVVVADGSKALFLRNSGDEMYPQLEVFREEEQDNPPSREQGANRPGRMGDAGSHHRSAVADTDWHQLAEDRFAKELAEILYRQAHKQKFDHLVLVAAPHVLGEMRKELHKEVTDRLIAEVDKDLTNHPVDKIEKLLLASAA